MRMKGAYTIRAIRTRYLIPCTNIAPTLLHPVRELSSPEICNSIIVGHENLDSAVVMDSDEFVSTDPAKTEDA